MKTDVNFFRGGFYLELTVRATEERDFARGVFPKPVDSAHIGRVQFQEIKPDFNQQGHE